MKHTCLFNILPEDHALLLLSMHDLSLKALNGKIHYTTKRGYKQSNLFDASDALVSSAFQYLEDQDIFVIKFTLVDRILNKVRWFQCTKDVLYKAMFKLDEAD